MRITGGKALNRKLITPKSGKKNPIRPTSDRVREALFNILGTHVENSVVLDLYTGTGSLAIEALSRGARSAVLVDVSTTSLELVRKNILLASNQFKAELIRLNLERKASYTTIFRKFAEKNPFNLIFLDPPYEKKLAEMALTMVEKTGLLAPEGIIVAEERCNVQLPEQFGTINLMTSRRYGETGIWIYQQEN